MIMDALVIWGYKVMVHRFKKVQETTMEVEHVAHEIKKKETKAYKLVEVQHRKNEQKKVHMDQKGSHTKPRNPIMQPDKNTKSRK